jgi:hypothetical protein
MKEFLAVSNDVLESLCPFKTSSELILWKLLIDIGLVNASTSQVWQPASCLDNVNNQKSIDSIFCSIRGISFYFLFLCCLHSPSPLSPHTHTHTPAVCMVWNIQIKMLFNNWIMWPKESTVTTWHNVCSTCTLRWVFESILGHESLFLYVVLCGHRPCSYSPVWGSPAKCQQVKYV